MSPRSFAHVQSIPPMGEKSIYCHMQVVMRVCALRSTINFGRSTIVLQKMSHHPFRAGLLLLKLFSSILLRTESKGCNLFSFFTGNWSLDAFSIRKTTLYARLSRWKSSLLDMTQTNVMLMPMFRRSTSQLMRH